jgi:predicted cupin superfamily sugar epimerase
MQTAEYWIEKLSLEKHPEGGWFRQVYRADEMIKKEHLPRRYSGARHHATSIYFLITGSEFSAFHRISSDETWHFYEGSTVTVHIINSDGKYSTVKLGNDFEKGEAFQYTIEHGWWFGAETESFALIGCTVSPGFDYEDFELGNRERLAKMFPEHREVIRKLTRT